MSVGIVSDVHLGYKYSRAEDFINFLENYNERKIVLLGDIFDFWRKNNASVIINNERVFELLATIPAVVYVVGNHDYSILDYYKRNNTKNIRVVKNYYLETLGNSYFMEHGYTLDVVSNMEPMTIEEYEAFSSGMCNAGEIGGTIASSFYSIYEHIDTFIHRNDKFYANKNINKLARSKFLPYINGMKPNSTYIFGHTHEALEDRNTFNCGCWIKGTPCNYVLIEDDTAKLMKWCD